jgi:excisionase family DNA binding protein
MDTNYVSRATAHASPANTEESTFLTVPEVAKILRIGINLAYGLVKTGELPSRKFGSNIRVPRAAFNRWLSEQS